MEVFSGPFKDKKGKIIGAVEVVRNVTEQIRLSEECVTLRREIERQARFNNIVTQSKEMKAIFRLIERVASTMSSVLIFGESGTGKELITRAVVFNSDRKFDVRIISATNRNLEEAIREGVFREDLFFRLNVIPIFLPPLRKRKEDIPPLATHLLQRLCDTHSRNLTGVSSETLKIFMNYSWPGNVREMENVIEYALHLTDEGNPIRPEQLPPKLLAKKDASWSSGNFVSVEEYAKESILALQTDHSEEQIAEILGISRKNLWEKRKRWNLPKPEKSV